MATNFVNYWLPRWFDAAKKIPRIFYALFVEYFRKNKILFENRDKNEVLDEVDSYHKTMTKEEIYINSIKLSIYLCYYMRLSNKEFRKELALKMNRLFGAYPARSVVELHVVKHFTTLTSSVLQYRYCSLIIGNILNSPGYWHNDVCNLRLLHRTADFIHCNEFKVDWVLSTLWRNPESHV